ncbi:MAG: 50S ribosomal protein L17 [Tunicatimonas sp.]|uniref:50S ribosomal protein L17 n=1 Tax=Tunicatimonas sp. TaxID=1940096 RepID=UPI003C752845
MRHGKRFNHLGRTSPHRKSMLANMASSLIVHKRLTTTVAKAKALRQYVEPIITRSKVDDTHSRRVVFSYLKDKDSSRVLFDEVAERIADRPGGYTRIIKLGNRLGDNAEMCMIELVDFNEIYQQEEKQAKGKTRRSRRGSKKKSSAPQAEDTSTQTASTSKAVAEPEEPQTQEENAVAESETQEEVVELSGEVVVEETTESEANEIVEAIKEEEKKADSDDNPQAKDTSSENDDEKETKG